MQEEQKTGPVASTRTEGALPPLLAEALTRLTHTLQVHRAISDDFEKDLVVGCLLALHDAGVPLQQEPIHAWVTAHHWSPRSVDQVVWCMASITTGDRPYARPVLPADYLHQLRRRVTAQLHPGGAHPEITDS
ncbi:MAG: DUF4539 domain-containing protein [Actinomycetota bacterium]|nr:DUF4539 domain-containing protein [Actinomycetota bacterium]